MGSIQVSKRTARKLINEGYTIKMIPGNIRLKNLWFEPFSISKEILEKEHRTFDEVVNEYKALNCNNNQMGRYPKYYVHLDFTLDAYVGACYNYVQTKNLYAQMKKEAEEF